jgi:mRNA interferase RelE/StbE
MRSGVSWTIEFERSAAREFHKLDPEIQRRIRDFFQQRILTADNPRVAGKPLRGKQANLWRYRIGSWRVIAEIQDHRLIILIVRVGHRGEVYRK